MPFKPTARILQECCLQPFEREPLLTSSMAYAQQSDDFKLLHTPQTKAEGAGDTWKRSSKMQWRGRCDTAHRTPRLSSSIVMVPLQRPKKPGILDLPGPV